MDYSDLVTLEPIGRSPAVWYFNGNVDDMRRVRRVYSRDTIDRIEPQGRGRNPFTRNNQSVRRVPPYLLRALPPLESNIKNNIRVGNRSVLGPDTEFTDQNWMSTNRPTNLTNYRYLQSEVQRGVVPRAYDKDAINSIRQGRTGQRNPFTRAVFDPANVRRIP
jgi:hypothetical protein